MIPLISLTAPRGSCRCHHLRITEEDMGRTVTCPRSHTWKVVEPGLEPRSVWAPSSGSSHSCAPKPGVSQLNALQGPSKAKSTPEKPLGFLKHLHAHVSFRCSSQQFVRWAGQGLTSSLPARGQGLEALRKWPKVTPSQDQSWDWNLGVAFSPFPQSCQALRFCVSHN